MLSQPPDDNGKRIRKNFGELHFSRQRESKCQPLDWWRELGVYTRAIAASVDPVPSSVRQVHRIQTVKAVRRAVIVATQSLIAEPGAQRVRAEQRGEQMTLRVAVAATLLQHFRRCAR